MPWDWFKRILRGQWDSRPAGGDTTAEIPWVGSDENPWGVSVLDVRPVTLRMISASRDEQCATNALSFVGDDGTRFIGQKPAASRRISAALRFRIDRALFDGALFVPYEMEHKWAIYFHQAKIIFIRSWTRSVVAIADTQVAGDFLEISAVEGGLDAEGEEPSFALRVLDFLLRSHALNLVYPAPLLPGLEANPRTAALWCMSYFGKLAHFATPHVLSTEPPAEPLRSDSLLHMAVARGDAEKVRSHLEKGVPIDLRGRGGLAPLHWSVARDDAAMMTLLLAAGSPVDVRSVEGATPLMNAAQQRKIEHVAFLLREGADANAADHRGFTALHRAAEMGEQEIVRLLLDRGASRNVQAQGHTPRSLAAFRGEQAIVDLLDRQDGDC